MEKEKLAMFMDDWAGEIPENPLEF